MKNQAFLFVVPTIIVAVIVMIPSITTAVASPLLNRIDLTNTNANNTSNINIKTNSTVTKGIKQTVRVENTSPKTATNMTSPELDTRTTKPYIKLTKTLNLIGPRICLRRIEILPLVSKTRYSERLTRISETTSFQ